MSDFTGGVIRGHMGAIAPPFYRKMVLKISLKSKRKMAGYRMSKNIFEKCLKRCLRQSLRWREMINGKRFMLAHIYVAKFPKLPF